MLNISWYQSTSICSINTFEKHDFRKNCQKKPFRERVSISANAYVCVLWRSYWSARFPTTWTYKDKGKVLLQPKGKQNALLKWELHYLDHLKLRTTIFYLRVWPCSRVNLKTSTSVYVIVYVNVSKVAQRNPSHTRCPTYIDIVFSFFINNELFLEFKVDYVHYRDQNPYVLAVNRLTESFFHRFM